MFLVYEQTSRNKNITTARCFGSIAWSFQRSDTPRAESNLSAWIFILCPFASVLSSTEYLCSNSQKTSWIFIYFIYHFCVNFRDLCNPIIEKWKKIEIYDERKLKYMMIELSSKHFSAKGVVQGFHLIPILWEYKPWRWWQCEWWRHIYWQRSSSLCHG